MGPEDFEYDLPDELIAQYPLDERDASKLLVLDRKSASITHSSFASLREFLSPGDLLILNNTKVLPARLFGKKETGGKVEILLLKSLDEETTCNGTLSQRWRVMAKPAKGLATNTLLIFDKGLIARVIKRCSDGQCEIELSFKNIENLSMEKQLERVAFPPLPPYIKRSKADIKQTRIDRQRYQTVFASEAGAVAAPTAGLHFTPALIAGLKETGVQVAFVTLHTGPGTFLPVRAKSLEEHTMHREYYSIEPAVFESVRRARCEGRRVICVGSTTTRSLESAVNCAGGFNDPVLTGETGLFIYPGYKFKVADVILTNFHLPRSTLLMLVSAFASRRLILESYSKAVKERYRFFSYGDAMLIL